MKLQIPILLVLTAVCLSAGCVAQSASRKKSSKKVAPVRLVEATTQRMSPGNDGSDTTDQKRFVLVWNQAKPPETFFWRPDRESWQTAAVTRVHKKTKGQTKVADPSGLWYVTELIELSTIKKGDTLELQPYVGGRDIMPTEVKNSAAKAIYYKTENGAWGSLSVGTIKRLKPMVAR